MTEQTQTTTEQTQQLPFRLDENWKPIPEAVDLEAVKDIPTTDENHRMDLARTNLILRLYDAGLLQGNQPPHVLSTIQAIKEQAAISFEADPSKHFLEYFLRIQQEHKEKQRQQQEEEWKRRQEEWRLKEERERENSLKANEHNKPILFDALSRLGVATVTVEFDGSGDSGQIEDIKGMNPAGEQVPLPEDHTVTILAPDHPWPTDNDWRTRLQEQQQCEICKQKGLHEPHLPIEKAIETFCEDWLNVAHGGWENNEGGFGEFEFNVPDRTLKLEFNERQMEFHTSTEEL